MLGSYEELIQYAPNRDKNEENTKGRGKIEER